MPRTASSPSPARVLSDERTGELFARARLVYTAVSTRSGPHVTPQAFAVFAGRLWLITPRGSLKARVIRRDKKVGALVRHGRRSLVIAGTAEVISPWGFGDAARLARHALTAQGALATYAARNARLLTGYLRDLLSLPAGGLPIDRALIAIRPQRALLLDGDSVVARWGRWSSPRVRAKVDSNVRTGADAGDLLSQVPADAAEASHHGGACVAGWLGASGPLALPASWDPAGCAAVTAAELVDAAKLERQSPACITIDHSAGIRPTRFRGVMLRGVGTAAGARGRRVTLRLQVARVTWWNGFSAGTVAPPQPD
jgi:hypothetical protein